LHRSTLPEISSGTAKGSPALDGIPYNSKATALSVNASTNSITVQRARDEATYSPHLLKTMTAESTVYRQEQREFTSGDRVQFTRAGADQGIRKGELGTITAITDTFNVKLDKGSDLRLNADQSRYLEHGYAVESIKAGLTRQAQVIS
jgi:hypothetical protein